MNESKLPESLLEAVAYFSNEGVAHDFLVKVRWPEGVRCAHCKSDNIGKLSISGEPGKERRVWNCKSCKKQFTAKIGTIFQDSPWPLSKWLPAVWLVVNAKNGISSTDWKTGARLIGALLAWNRVQNLEHRLLKSGQRGFTFAHFGRFSLCVL